jgi:ankyrin repeat protein
MSSSTGGFGHTLAFEDPQARAAIAAVQTGDTDRLSEFLDADQSLALARVATSQDSAPTRTLLHVATDWPGHFPSVAATISLLASAGANPDARLHGAIGETPLHWAASSNDIEAIAALVRAGATLDLAGASIAEGTALTLATAFGQWDAAHLLVDLGATSGLWEAATLGQLDRVSVLVEEQGPTAEQITGAFWGACHGGQLNTAQFLLERGADPTWVGWDQLTPRQAAVRARADDVVTWLDELA